MSKFVEVHEFFFKVETEKINKILKRASINGSFNGIQNREIHTADLVTTMPLSLFDITGSSSQFGHLSHFFIDQKSLIIICIDITTFDETMRSNISEAEKRLKYWIDIILFKMSKTRNFYILPVATKCDLYMSTTRKDTKSSVKETKQKFDQPYLWFQNCDLFTKATQKKIDQILCNILDKIRQHFEDRLSFVKSEVAKIVALSTIPHSLYARLLKLKEVQDMLETFKGIHDQIPLISNLTLHGIHPLNQLIRSIVCNNEVFFPSVDKKIPTLWIEVEKFVQSNLTRIPTTRFADETPRYENPNALSSISGFCIDFSEYQERIIDKYGMKHMITDITRYLNSEGKVLWFENSDSLSTKLFLKPNMLFDLLHALYRKDFDENFNDNHLQVTRAKLSLYANISQERVEHLKQDLLLKGCANMDLLKLLWSPIILSDSLELLNELVILLMAFFNIGYPQVIKSKMNGVFENYSNLLESSKNKSSNRMGTSNNHMNKRDSIYSVKQDNLRSDSKMSYHEALLTARSVNNVTQREGSESESAEILFDCIMIPFYMPRIRNEDRLIEISNTLTELATNLANIVFEANGGRLILPRICLKYSFPWGTMPGLFERFTVNCIITTDLYYKMHWKDAVYAYNEQNTIG